MLAVPFIKFVKQISFLIHIVAWSCYHQLSSSLSIVLKYMDLSLKDLIRKLSWFKSGWWWLGLFYVLFSKALNTLILTMFIWMYRQETKGLSIGRSRRERITGWRERWSCWWNECLWWWSGAQYIRHTNCPFQIRLPCGLLHSGR